MISLVEKRLNKYFILIAMSNLQVFTNEEFGRIRTVVQEDGTPLFCARDVAFALAFHDPKRAVRYHCKGGVMVTAPSKGGAQPTRFIDESDVYRLVLGSHIPQAEKFRDWIVEEVIPALRQSGHYAMPNKKATDHVRPMTDDEILARAQEIMQKRLKERNEEIHELKSEVNEARPKVMVAEAFNASEATMLIGDLAKLLAQRGVPNMGQNRFFKWLKENGYLMKNNKPKQKYIDEGLFEMQTYLVKTPYGEIERFTTKVTGKGQTHFICCFLSPTLVLLP